MQPRSKLIILLSVWAGLTSAWAAAPDKPPQVPQKFEFIRTLDIEGGAYAWGKQNSGAQFWRVETRYRDPDVNAFVGLIGVFTHFNEDIVLGDPLDGTFAPLLANWGADMGIVRGAHVWALDLMGA